MAKTYLPKTLLAKFLTFIIKYLNPTVSSSRLCSKVFQQGYVVEKNKERKDPPRAMPCCLAVPVQPVFSLYKRSQAL